VKGLGGMLAPIQRRVQMMLARAVIAGIDDATAAQTLQVDLLADETMDGIESFGDYGFTSHPHPGAEAIMASVGGLRSHGVVIAVADRRYRLRGLKQGEVALYDDLGQQVLLGRDGIRVTTPHAIIDADRVDLAGEGGKAVARVGDTVEGGVIKTGSAKVFAG